MWVYRVFEVFSKYILWIKKVIFVKKTNYLKVILMHLNSAINLIFSTKIKTKTILLYIKYNLYNLVKRYNMRFF